MDFSTLPQLLRLALWLAIAIYVVGIIAFILLDNRTPQSTFAWLFLMLTFPVLGFIIYIFFGRNYKAFSNEGKLARIGGLSSLYEQVTHNHCWMFRRIMWKKSGSKNPNRIAKNCCLLCSATHRHY